MICMSGHYIPLAAVLVAGLHLVLMMIFQDFFSQFKILQYPYFWIAYTAFWCIIGIICDNLKHKAKLNKKSKIK